LIGCSNLRPTDVLLFGLFHGSQSALDFTVTSIDLSGYHVAMANNPLYAVSKQEALKITKHQAICAANGLAFSPMAVDIWGVWSSMAQPIFKALAQ